MERKVIGRSRWGEIKGFRECGYRDLNLGGRCLMVSIFIN